MSANQAQLMQMLLAQRLGQTPQQPMAGGGNAGPQMNGQVSPMNAASQIAQKLMLMKALQARVHPGGTPIDPNGQNGMQGPVPQQPLAQPSIPQAGVQLGWTGGNGLPPQ